MNRLAFIFAWRYLFSKKSTSAINVITSVSMLGIGFMSMAMVLVLSVFNGFEGLTLSLYNEFNPELVVEPATGKVFTLTESQWQQLRDLEGIDLISEVLMEKAALRYKDRDFIGTLKGVDAKYSEVTGVDSAIVRGAYLLEDRGREFAVVGAGVEARLGINIDDPLQRITVLIPNRNTNTGLLPSSAFNQAKILPVGTFSIQMEFDSKYVFVPIGFMRQLLKYRDNEVSALEIKLTDGWQVADVTPALTTILGNGFKLKDRYQQNEFLYKIMRTEKWATYAIMSLILFVAVFNIIGSLSMLVLEKKQDIAILKTMGATKQLIQQIFLLEGLLISLLASFVGIVLALIICWLQIEFKLIPLPGSGTFVISHLPVQLKGVDLLLVIVTVVSITLVASWLPAYRTSRMNNLIQQE